MNQFALGLVAVLFMMTNFGYAQSVYTLKGSNPKTLGQLQKPAENIKISQGAFLKDLESLKKTNTQIDFNKAVEGGVHSGGGTLVKTSDGIGLLDLYLYNKEAFFSQSKGYTLKVTKAYQDFGFEFLTENNTEILGKTLRQIEKWAPSSPVMAHFISTQIKELPIYYTSYQLGFKDQSAFIPKGSNLQQSDISLAAYYIGNIGVFIQKPVFDGLSEKNQVALLIHEGLRHAQKTWAYPLTDEELQQLTADALREPAPGMTLDKGIYIKGALTNPTKSLMDSEETKLFKVADAYACEYVPRSCNVKELSIFPQFSEDEKEAILASINERVNIYEAAKDVLFRNYLISERNRERYEKLYATYEHLSVASSRLLNVTAKVIVSGIDHDLRQMTFSLNTKFGADRLAGLTKHYNENPRYFSEDAMLIRKFVSFMKDKGYFK